MIHTTRELTSGINMRYILVAIAAVLLTWLLHEFAHWLCGELLGNEMGMTFNSSYPRQEAYKKPWHATLISSAGPLLTLMQAIVFYRLLKKAGTYLLFPFLFTPFYMRLLAGVMNLINLNDEGRVSNDLGLGTYTLPVIIAGILFYFVYDIIKARKFGAKFIVGNILLTMLLSSIIIIADQAGKLVIL